MRLNEDDKEECYLTQVRMLKEQKQILRGKCCQERKVCFISEASSKGVRVEVEAGEGRGLSKGRIPHPSTKSFYRQREAATYRNSIVSSDSHLEMVMQ